MTKLTLDRAWELCWHPWHNTLVACCVYEKRLAKIEKCKPKKEQPLRFRLFQKVKGKLPKEVIEVCRELAELQEKRDAAWEIYHTAWKKYITAKEKYYPAGGKFCAAWGKLYAAQQKFDAAREIYNQVITKHQAAIDALHEKECPDCPWDGKTIFGDQCND